MNFSSFCASTLFLIRPKAGVALVWMMRMAKLLGLDEVKEWLEGGDVLGARACRSVSMLLTDGCT